MRRYPTPHEQMIAIVHAWQVGIRWRLCFWREWVS